MAVSALVFQPFVPLPASPPVECGQGGTAVTDVDNWVNLTAFLDLLRQTTLFAPLAASIDDLSWFIRAHENVATARKEYKDLHAQLEGVFKDLRIHFSGATPPAMTTSMLNLCESIHAEIRQVYGTQERNTISRYLQAEQDLGKLTECYRRIQGHLERIMVRDFTSEIRTLFLKVAKLNANLNIWRIVDKQTTEAQLGKLNPSMAACYDSAEANVVQRRECAAKTREQVLVDLITWKNNVDVEKVCWMNGMAGTGKTTIATTLCSTLNNKHELSASFFCTRSIPTCRDVKLILPTIAYQLARFSDPFRAALLKVLEQDPDVHTKVPRVQFRRMILQPFQEVSRSLPRGVVIVIDALDECDDGNGVEQILEVLLESASDLPVKFLLSSRPEYHIRARIGKSTLKTQLVLHELDGKMVKQDIETYLRGELELMSIPLTNAQLDALVERAGILFIYAATVVRYIKGGDTMGRLAAVLQAPGAGQTSNKNTKEIDKLYRAVLMSAFNDDDLEQFEREQMELVLHTVVCAQEPLTVDALAGLLHLERAQVTDGLKPLWSVLHVSESDTAHRVSILHASFPDYILDPKRSNQLACDTEVHNGKLAELCFARIGRNPSQINICGLESSYVFDKDVPRMDDNMQKAIPLDLLYASEYWAVHLSLGRMSNNRVELLHEFLSKRLLLWMETLNIAKKIDQGIGLMQKAITWLKDTEGPESTIILTRDARRFVTTFATSPVSQSTPHLYVSMLSSWPDHQPIAQHYSRRAENLTQIKGMHTAERQLGLLSLVPAGNDTYCVAYSPTGRLFAAGIEAGKILVWNAASCRMTIDPINAHSNAVRSIAISPDGTCICSGSHDETICVWDPQNGQLVAGPLNDHIDKVWSIAYSPDGRWLASGSFDGSVCIWSTESWEKKQQFVIGHGGRVFSVAFSLDGSAIAASYESVIYLWDPLSDQTIGKPFEGHSDIIRTLVFLPDRKHLVSGSDDRTIRIWNITSRRIAFGPFHDHIDRLSSLTVSPGGKFLASASEDGTMRMWDTTTWQTRALIQHTGTVRSVTFSPDGSQLVSGSVDANVRVWDVKDILDGQRADNQSEGHSAWVRSVAFSPCGKYLVSGSYDMTVRIRDSQAGQLLHPPLKGHHDRVLSVGVSADSSRILSVSADRVIHIWDRQSGELEYTIGPIETDGRNDAYYQQNWPADFLFDGRRVVCGSQSGRIYMWEDSKLSYSCTGHNDQVTSIAFSPDGQSFVSGAEDGEVIIWKANNGERLLNPFDGHSDCVRSTVFSPDGSLIASGSYDHTILLWNINTGLPVGDAFRGHTDYVRSVAFSSRGDQLVSGSQDWTLRIWDIASGQSIATLNGHIGPVLSVAFSPDQSRIVSGSADKTIRFWDVPPAIGTSTQGQIDSEHPVKEIANDTQGYRPPEWEMDEDGWVRDSHDRLLLWVPPDLRSITLSRHNPVLISSQGRIELDFTGARIGDEWVTCYQPW
ncbi:unnamed protein product [Rhizoctonia solani]|uniref:NACHT domain-containing protein n=1 Tax=Rhizoctonia solani TaxID=456999 RepID=A0A8H3HL07_9AGAM|nr:unnamed protein product [Rhizoctonia solani]